MHANQLTFGIEIETIATPRAIEAGLRIGPYGRGIQVPYLPEGWTACRDGSISGRFLNSSPSSAFWGNGHFIKTLKFYLPLAYYAFEMAIFP